MARDFEVVDGGGFVPVAAAEGGVLRLEAPGDEGGGSRRFLPAGYKAPAGG